MIAPWAKEEVAAVDLGDERLDARLVTLLSALGSRPNLSIPAACGGRAEMEAAYRFFDNDKVTFENVLAPHIGCTIARLAAQEVALLVQDTTEIDLTRPEQQVEGAGTLDGVRPGFWLHTLHAFTREGIPLGTVGGWRSSTARRASPMPPPRTATSANAPRSKRKRACVGLRVFVRHGNWRSNCRASHASV